LGLQSAADLLAKGEDALVGDPAFQTIDVGDLDGCCRLHELTGGRSVPQAVVDGRPIGGYDELAVFVRGVVSRPLDPDDRRLQPRPLRARKTA
jgi:hypothetical protein